MKEDRATRILLVAADPGERLQLRRILEAAGHDVSEAPDGATAIAVSARQPADLVVLEESLPDIDGFEVCARLRAQAEGSATVVLMRVEREDEATLERAYAAGATDFSGQSMAASLLAQRVRYLVRSARAVRELQRSEARLTRTQRTARLASWERDLSSDRLDWSRELHRILGTDPETFVPTLAAYRAILHPQDGQTLARAQEDAVRRRVAYGIELRVLQPDGGVRLVLERGEPILGVSGEPESLIGTVQDISPLFYDPTTQLPNSKLFQDRLSIACAQSQRTGVPLALLVIDLDRFRSVDSALGREAADSILEKLARRLEKCVGPGDTVARIGGDEFALLLPGLSSMEKAAEIGLRAMEGIKQPLVSGAREVFVTATVGIGLFPRDGADAESLLANAVAATYAAKEKGQENLRRYTARLNAKEVQRVLIESGLRGGLEREELVLHYQPIVSLVSGRTESVEALVRWRKPDGTLVQPGDFIPVVETSGLMIAIDSWVLKTACREIADLPAAAGIAVSVNLSARQLLQPNLLAQIGEALASSGLAPGRLGIEITEGTAMQDVARSIETLRSLRALGLRISVDDFGTGYSSLSYLQRLPLDIVKLDGAFVRDIETKHDDAAIATAAMAMAHSLGLSVVAEGVETLGQLRHLARQGCDAIQGFLVSPGVPVAELAPLLSPEGVPALRELRAELRIRA